MKKSKLALWSDPWRILASVILISHEAKTRVISANWPGLSSAMIEIRTECAALA